MTTSMMPAVEQGQRVARDLEPETADREPQPETIDDGLVCWVCQFADCEEHPEEPLLSTGCACCRPGSSGGRAHVSCLASSAVHQEIFGMGARPASKSSPGQ
jgi:hypothetical protein